MKLELITNIDIYNFLENGLRGGIFVITHRKGEAINKYLDTYDKNKESKYVIYLDANNLYGYGLSQCLPYGRFEWVKNPENFNLEDVKEDSDIGHILEVDIEYSKELLDLNNDYLLCVEKLVVKEDMLSDYCKMISDKHKLNIGKFSKLVPTLCS